MLYRAGISRLRGIVSDKILLTGVAHIAWRINCKIDFSNSRRFANDTREERKKGGRSQSCKEEDVTERPRHLLSFRLLSVPPIREIRMRE